MRLSALGLTSVALCLACLALGCEGTPGLSQYQSATLTHAGFDFSTGSIPATWETSDGHTANWPPMPTINVEKEYGAYVWFTPFANTETQNFIKDMGAVSLASVTQVPSTWDAGAGQTLEPLQVDHVYVIKCHNGYGKFLVKTINPQQEFEWSVAVEYAYTAGTTFDQ